MKRPSVAIAAIVGGLVVALIALFAFASNDPDRGSGNALVGSLAPEIIGVDHEGRDFDLDGYRGQWVFVNFYNSDCVGCVVEQPQLAAWDDAHESVGDATIVGVHYLDSAFEETLDPAEFFEKYGGGWPVVEDPDSQIAFAYGVVKLPESFLVDPSGTVVHKFVGGTTAAEIEAEMIPWSEREVEAA